MQIEYVCHWCQWIVALSHSQDVRLSVVAFKVIASSKSQTAQLLLRSSEEKTFMKADSWSGWAEMVQLLCSLCLILMLTVGISLVSAFDHNTGLELELVSAAVTDPQRWVKCREQI